MVDEITAHSRAATCDRELAPLRRRIAQELDRRGEWIAQRAAEAAALTSTPLVAVGNARLSREKGEPNKNAWDHHTFSWAQAGKLLEKALRSDQFSDWRDLNSAARGLLVSDQNRVLYGLSYEFDASAESKLRSLREAVREARQRGCRAECEDLRLSPALRDYLDQSRALGPSYRDFLRALNSSSRSRMHLEALEELLSTVLQRWDFFPEPTVRRTAIDTLQLTMNVGDLRGGEEIVRTYLEKVWSQFGLKLRVDFQTEAPRLPALYEFRYDSSFGGRAVMYREKLRYVQLYQGSRLATVAHEVGHILGFQDRYYEVWQPRNCDYVQSSQSTDLMSMSYTGRVLRSHIAELKTRYRWQPRR